MKIFLPLMFLLTFQSTNALEYYTDDTYPSILTVRGEFTHDDTTKFAKHVLENNVHTVEFDSTGGNLVASIKIGKFIREQTLNTAVTNNNSCVSACAYAFMGGIKRSLSTDSNFAMHRPYFDEYPAKNYSEGYDSGILTSVLVTTHLIKMGLDPLIASLHLIREDLTSFSTEQQTELNITTSQK